MTARETRTIDGDALDVRPVVRNPAALGIGIVGSGNIVENAHIPAYRAAGMRVVAVASRTPANAKAMAERTGVPRAHARIADLIADPEVAIVDIAVPPDYQPEIASAAMAVGKHVLAQKPMAMDFSAARALVEEATRRGVVLAVNQNGRFDPSINAARALISQGLLGERVGCAMQMHITMPWQSYYNDPKYKELMMLHMSVHHLDQFRWLFGTPARVTAMTRHVPGDPLPGENLAIYTVQYDDGFLATSVDNGANWSSDFAITYRIFGTEAVMIGEIGWPHYAKSTLRYELRKEPSVWHELRFTRSWFPDAFGATMGELMSAIDQGRTPSNGGRDPLDTMRTVFAAYRSAETGRAVALNEIE